MSTSHAIVLCHGLFGSASHVRFIAECLAHANHLGSRPLIHVSKANTGVLSSIFTTTDGIDRGGMRLADEISCLLRNNRTITKLSIVGVSLGGLHARAALGLLEGTISPEVSLINFVTFASPHLGVRGHLAAPLDAAVRRGIIGATGHELLLLDTPSPRVSIASGSTGTGICGCSSFSLQLLPWMAHPLSPHHRMLKRFQNRVLVSVIKDDDKVPYWSAAILNSGYSAATGVSLAGSDIDIDILSSQTLASAYPHIVAAYQRRDESEPPHPSMRANSQPARAQLGQQPDIKFDVTQVGSGSLAAGRQHRLSRQIVSLPFIEESMIQNLRLVGLWTNVDADFPEFPAIALNHLRVSVSRNFVRRVGQDVPRFVFQRAWLPG